MRRCLCLVYWRFSASFQDNSRNKATNTVSDITQDIHALSLLAAIFTGSELRLQPLYLNLAARASDELAQFSKYLPTGNIPHWVNPVIITDIAIQVLKISSRILAVLNSPDVEIYRSFVGKF